MSARVWLLAVAWLTLDISALGAQVRGTTPARRDSVCVQSALLLKRIAAAVDGQLQRGRVWVVYECSDTGQVLGVATTAQEAQTMAASLTEVMHVTSSEYIGKAHEVAVMMGLVDVYINGCTHHGLSQWRGGLICGDERIPRADVASITLTYTMRNGRTIARAIPLTADALFLTYPAIEKFVYPYYLGIVGVDGVARMQNEIFSAARNPPR